MKQVIFSEHGSADVLEITEVQKPRPGKGKLLIKTHAAGINYSDVLTRKSSDFMPIDLPYVLGSEIAGEIEEIGTNLTYSFKEKQKVLALMALGGGYSEYAVVPEDYCIPLPADIELSKATAAFVQGTTAKLLMDEVAEVEQGQTVFINGATGGVGSILIQLCKMKEATVIAGVGSADKIKIAKGFGADNCINYSSETWVEEILDLNGGPIHVVFDMLGGIYMEKSIMAIKAGGTLITYGFTASTPGNINQGRIIGLDLTVKGFTLGYYMQNHYQKWRQSIETIINLIHTNQLKIEIQAYPLNNVQEAHRDIEAQKTKGKVILIP